MALTIRRLISWLGTLVVLYVLAASAMVILHRGSFANELRWVFTRPLPPAVMFGRAYDLLGYAEQRKPGSEFNILRVLLRDRNPLVVRGALVITGDAMTRSVEDWQTLDLSSPHSALFERWFTRATPEERCAQLPYTLLQWHWEARSRWFDSALPVACAPEETETDHSNPQRSAADACWIVAGTLEKGPDWRPLSDAGVFNSAAVTRHLWLRLQVLDGLLVRGGGFNPTPLDEDTLRVELRLSLEQVLALLTDSREQVRWAAGRMLTVAGDRRGLPAFREWLTAHPNIPPGATQMLAELFGPDWRTAP